MLGACERMIFALMSKAAFSRVTSAAEPSASTGPSDVL